MLPEYFTIAIKDRYQCKVIFIPYGIRMGTDHFVLQPGLCNIDLAFLESEEDATFFVKKWAEVGVDFSGRIFSYGSPKLDVAKNLGKVIPDEWADAIKGRSVTLLVNSLGAFLSDPKAKSLLEKLREEQHG